MTSKPENTNVSNPVVGGDPVDITHKNVVHLLFLGGPFFITRYDRPEIKFTGGKRYKWYFVDTQAMTPDGDYIVCRTQFARLFDASTFIEQLKNEEEVQLKHLHEITAPIYLVHGKTPEEEEEERQHNAYMMAKDFKQCEDTVEAAYEVANKWFNTKHIFINDEINRKYPVPEYREFLKVSDKMENYGKFQREI